MHLGNPECVIQPIIVHSYHGKTEEMAHPRGGSLRKERKNGNVLVDVSAA